MNKRTKKITIIASCVLMLLGIISVPHVFAQEVSVTGNGSNANNTVSIAATEQTETVQTNNAHVTSKSTTTVHTGNNTLSDLSGNTATVKTGVANTTTNVSTTTNAATVAPGCGCTQNITATVSDNGDGTTNSIAVATTTTTNVIANQSADVTNAVSHSADTSNNSVTNATGTVTVQTGNSTNAANGLNDIANISVPSGQNDGSATEITGNGANTISAVSANDTNSASLHSNSSANVGSNLGTNYTTGGNAANYTDGSDSFITGNINGDALVQNGPVNVSINTKEHSKPTSPAPAPTQPANNNAPASSSSSSSPATTSSGSTFNGPVWVLGAFAHHIPITGGSYWFFIAFIGNILMMLLGGYLRLRSGRSPGFAYVVQ